MSAAPISNETWIAAQLQKEAEAEATLWERYRHGVESGYAGEVARAALSEGLSDEISGMLYRAWQDGHINTSSLRDTVPEVWIYNKSPGRCLGQRAWVRMFKAAGFLCRTEEWAESGVAVSPRFEISWTGERPAGQITVWRGAALSTGGRGMSWTLHRNARLTSLTRSGMAPRLASTRPRSPAGPCSPSSATPASRRSSSTPACSGAGSSSTSAWRPSHCFPGRPSDERPWSIPCRTDHRTF